MAQATSHAPATARSPRVCTLVPFIQSVLSLRFHKEFFRASSCQWSNYPLMNISEITISELDVYKALSSLDTTKASGCDGISAKLLKHCAIALYQPLHHLSSLSLCQHYIPLEWCTHLIRPIFKSGNKQDVKNYRPISLLCVVSKVLERLVYDNVIDEEFDIQRSVQIPKRTFLFTATFDLLEHSH